MAIACFLSVHAQKAGDVISVKPKDVPHYFTSSPIPDSVFQRMKGKSFGANCTVSRSSLRYLRVLHCNADGKTQVGEMVCNKAIAADLIDIFRQLYDAHYRIVRMVLIDDYDADDERSMTANNTSCFNFRIMTGSKTNRVSKHGMGLAVDINPRYNPYVKGNKVSPSNAGKYATNPEITRKDLCYRLFTQHGFKWGGAWRTLKDYQHFER